MNNHTIVDVYGTRWSFYTNASNNFCYKRGNTKDEILLRNITNEFDIAVDENGHFHIVLQDSTGTLIYIKYDYNEWKKYELLKNKHSLPKISCIKLIMAGSLPVAFYLLEHKGQKLLAEHKIHRGTVTSPIIIDIVSRSSVFDVCLDEKRCFHLIYKNDSENIIYKIAPAGAKLFSESYFPCEHDILSVALISDSDLNLHIAYVANINSYYALFYYNTLLKETKCLAFGINSKAKLTFDFSEGKIHVRWTDSDRVFECVSSDNGKSFTKPVFIKRGT